METSILPLIFRSAFGLESWTDQMFSCDPLFNKFGFKHNIIYLGLIAKSGIGMGTGMDLGAG